MSGSLVGRSAEAKVCRHRPLSVQIAMAVIGDDTEYEKIKADMIKDGFQQVWGVNGFYSLNLRKRIGIIPDILFAYRKNTHRDF